ncbi:MAG: hypothetical protein N5P05_001615 [Chroococcopsis gigantea SAG 12.99]|jgi:hypothetical protein|nr:hypothetical protein [Chroococcopsis gigantea SAG 12.99]
MITSDLILLKEVKDYVSMIEAYFTDEIVECGYFSKSLSKIQISYQGNPEQEILAICQLITDMAQRLELKWLSVPTSAYPIFVEISRKIDQLPDKRRVIGQSLKYLQAVLEDIIEFVDVTQFVSDQRRCEVEPELKKKSQEILKEAENLQESPEEIDQWLVTYLETGANGR